MFFTKSVAKIWTVGNTLCRWERGGRWEGVVEQPPQRAVWQYLSKPKMQVPFHSVIPLLGIYLKDITHVQSDMYTSLFTVLLFIIAKILEMT